MGTGTGGEDVRLACGTVSPAPLRRAAITPTAICHDALLDMRWTRARLLFKANLLRFRAFSSGDGHVLGRLPTCED